MDQTNPLSEVTHKRRLSALGPGGCRASGGVRGRDVHPTHYGRICPIETPEGPNIGLISSLSCYGADQRVRLHRVALRKVKDGRWLEFVNVLSAGGQIHRRRRRRSRRKRSRRTCRRSRSGASRPSSSRTPSTVGLGGGQYTDRAGQRHAGRRRPVRAGRVNARQAGAAVLAPRDKVEFMDVSPKQLVSVAASLIPFLEHDDANRALMGSNMQRQAVRCSAPARRWSARHGVHHRATRGVVVARRAGTVDYVDSQRIVVRVHGARATSPGRWPDIYA